MLLRLTERYCVVSSDAGRLARPVGDALLTRTRQTISA